MNQFQFLSQLKRIPAPAGDGVRRDTTINLITDLRTAAGLVLTAATTPAVVAVETNALVVQAVASSNVLGSFTFAVPKDYDTIADELKIRVLGNSAGTTDVPTLNATIYRKRAATALTAALTTVASAAVPNNTAKAGELTIGVSANSLQPGDVLTINLTSGAHTTDAINIYSVTVQYKSGIVFNDPTAR